MTTRSVLARGTIGTGLAAVLAAGLGLAAGSPASAATLATIPAAAGRPANVMTLSVGRGQLVNLPGPMTDLFVADDKIADVQVRSPTQLYVFGKGNGETSVYATAKSGAVLYSASVRVGMNLDNVGAMLKLAMPDAAITATTMSGLVLLTGTVATPDDVEEASRLVQAFVGKDIQVVSRLKTATPLQVNLRVKIAEVSRQFAKQIGVNLLSRDLTGGFTMGVAQGRNFGSIGNVDTSTFPQVDASSLYGLPSGSLNLPFNPATGQFITGGTAYNFSNLLTDGASTLGLAGKLFGVDIAAAIDLAENDGLVTTLAEPNLTALSGETASFLAGGEIPVPQNSGLGGISVEYKPYGVSLAFTPTVLADGRISMRVRPEVSQLTDSGAVTVNGYTLPALSTRRAETTVELGSGQSFMIGGLLSNGHNNTTDRAPGLGDLPIIGALFRSNSFQHNETELVIVVTPYLVKPVSAGQIALPTDGYKGATDFQRIIGGQSFDGRSGEKAPRPKARPATQSNGVETSSGASTARKAKGKATAAAEPGFSFN